MCGGRKRSHRLHLSVVIFFSDPSRSMTPIHLVLKIEYHLIRCLRAWEMLHFSLSLMNRYSIKPSLNVHFFIFVWLLSMDRILPDYFSLRNKSHNLCIICIFIMIMQTIDRLLLTVFKLGWTILLGRQLLWRK